MDPSAVSMGASAKAALWDFAKILFWGERKKSSGGEIREEGEGKWERGSERTLAHQIGDEEHTSPR